MALQHVGFVDLPPSVKAGGFDHAAVDESTGRVYVAHTANDAVDVFDVSARRYVRSIPDLPAVAGALVAAPDLVFTSNRGENTVGLATTADGARVEKIPVGIRPNGLAYDPQRARLLVAHVGDPAVADSFTVSVIDVRGRKRIADLAVPGRTRWAIYDPGGDAFHVNIADPPQIIVVESADPVRIRRVVAIPHGGPHGLDVDVKRRRLFCACDAGVLVAVDADSGKVVESHAISGVPDVVFFNAALDHLYVAIGEPGVIEVFETAAMVRRETVKTEAGAHTLSFDARRNIVCAFLPATHRAAVYEDH
jgi:DNA-binding beta-propeller fold protein YncE